MRVEIFEISMKERESSVSQRVFREKQVSELHTDLLHSLSKENWYDAVQANYQGVDLFLSRGLSMIQEFERAASRPHPLIHTDTDVVYLDSGPGPYSYDMLPAGKKDLDDVNYHKWGWSRKMDRARTRAGYTLACMITAQRVSEEKGYITSVNDLSGQDFRQHAPYLMYTSTDWQNAHIRDVHKKLKDDGIFKIPDDKLIMYEKFVTKDGEEKPIIHTEDQIEGFQFPNDLDGNPPRRVALVSHPAHIVRILHILGKYSASIPEGTILQPFPIPTPRDGVVAYAKAELLGTLATVLKKGRATLKPYTKYEL